MMSFGPVLLLRAKTAAERQQKQRGEEKTQPKKREHRHAGDRLAGKYPAAGGNHRRAAISSRSACRWRVPYAPSLCVGLPARHRAAVEDSLCRLRHLRRLVRLHKLLHVLRVFIVFPGHDDVHVGRVFYLR